MAGFLAIIDDAPSIFLAKNGATMCRPPHYLHKKIKAHVEAFSLWTRW